MLRQLLVVSSLLTVGTLLPLAGCDRGEAQSAAPASMPPPAVTIAAVKTGDVPVYLDGIGKMVSMESVSIVPQVNGKVVATHVEDGAYVKKGDLLFEIDKRPYQAELASAEATLAEHQAEISWAQADFKRTEELFNTNVASQLEFEQKKTNLGVIKAKIDSAQAAIDAAKLKLEYCEIHSPLDGRAGARLVDAGNVVKENDKPMLMIQKVDPIYAEFTVTENDLGSVRRFMASRGMQVGREDQLGLTVLVDVPANSQRVAESLGAPTTQPAANFAQAREGKLTFLDNSVQSATGTVRLRATVPNADLFFWPGQFVNVRLILTIKKNAVLLPVAAEQIGQQGPFVYVTKQADMPNPQTGQTQPATIAELRLITPGQLQGDMLVVESGLEGGEHVIVAGHMNVAPGGPVTVTNPQLAQAAPTQPQMAKE